MSTAACLSVFFNCVQYSPFKEEIKVGSPAFSRAKSTDRVVPSIPVGVDKGREVPRLDVIATLSPQSRL